MRSPGSYQRWPGRSSICHPTSRPLRSDGPDTIPNDLGIGLLFVALAAPGLWMAQRLRRTGLWIGVDGVHVRNPLRQYTLALSDAESFAPGVLAGGTNGTPCPMLKQTHGPAVGVWALRSTVLRTCPTAARPRPRSHTR